VNFEKILSKKMPLTPRVNELNSGIIAYRYAAIGLAFEFAGK
jgi:hypothetical protein